MVGFVDADWGEADGCWEFVAEDRGVHVAVVGVDEHAGDDAVPVECLRLVSDFYDAWESSTSKSLRAVPNLESEGWEIRT